MLKIEVDRDQATVGVEASGEVFDIIIELTAGAAELFFGLADGNEKYLDVIQSAFMRELPLSVKRLGQFRQEQQASGN